MELQFVPYLLSTDRFVARIFLDGLFKFQSLKNQKKNRNSYCCHHQYHLRYKASSLSISTTTTTTTKQEINSIVLVWLLLVFLNSCGAKSNCATIFTHSGWSRRRLGFGTWQRSRWVRWLWTLAVHTMSAFWSRMADHPWFVARWKSSIW